MNNIPREEPPVTHRHHPILNIDRDMENQARRRNERNRQNNINPRDRLFHALFMKIGHLYLRVVPKNFRVFLEVVVLLKGLFLFSILTYLHFSFGRTPLNCLNTTEGSWPKDGVLRVQIQPGVRLKHQIPRFFSSEENRILFHPCHDEHSPYTVQQCASISKDIKQFHDFKSRIYDLKRQSYRMNLSDFMIQQLAKDWKHYESFEYVMADKRGNTFKGFKPGDIIKEASLLTFYDLYLAFSEPEQHYMFEYSREFGFLRLSQETRKRLKIPVKIVSLDPNKEKCLGDRVSRFILKYFLGYDDVIMNSIKKIADIENNTGFMLNVMTGDHYKFVSWGIGRSSYFISLLLMFLFTISISTLLRYCHQQVFFFIIHILRMMDMNVVLAFPIAPLFTVILSLVGMETIMSEYFNDTTTSFYIILIVWAVDQFDTICCHTTTSQKYWLRFFYLYHFIFYAYHYRFNGQYSSLALAATWFLIQHSMLYFFHNYELPAIEDQMHGRRDEEAYLDEAVQMIVEGIEMVAGQNQNHQENAQEDAENQPDVPDENPPDNATVQPTEDGNPVREISTTDNGNRVFVFSGEGPFIQMVRDFIRQVHHRVNAVGGINEDVPEERENPPEGAEANMENAPVHANEAMEANIPDNLEPNLDTDFNYSANEIRPELDVLVRPDIHEEQFEDTSFELTSAVRHADNVYHQVQSLPEHCIHAATRHHMNSESAPHKLDSTHRNTNTKLDALVTLTESASPLEERKDLLKERSNLQIISQDTDWSNTEGVSDETVPIDDKPVPIDDEPVER